MTFTKSRFVAVAALAGAMLATSGCTWDQMVKRFDEGGDVISSGRNGGIRINLVTSVLHVVKWAATRPAERQEIDAARTNAAELDNEKLRADLASKNAEIEKLKRENNLKGSTGVLIPLDDKGTYITSDAPTGPNGTTTVPENAKVVKTDDGRPLPEGSMVAKDGRPYIVASLPSQVATEENVPPQPQ